MKRKLLIISVFTLFYSCQSNQENSENLEQIDKKSAREVVLTTKTVGDSVFHITKQKIWANDVVINEKIDTLITSKKSIPTDSASVPIYVTIQ